MSFLSWVWKKLYGNLLGALSFYAGIFGFFFLIIGSSDGNGEFAVCGCVSLILMVFLSIYGRYQKAHVPVIQQAPQQVIVQQVPQTHQRPMQAMPRPMQAMPRPMPPVQPLPPLPAPPKPSPPPLQKSPQTKSPPLPESGLPEGWTMEQWHYYGQQWLDSQK